MSRNILNNSNLNALSSNTPTAANTVTTDTPQTITANKVFTASQTYQGHLIGSEISNLHINNIYLRGETPTIFIENIQIDSSILSNNTDLLKTTGDYVMAGDLSVNNLSLTGNITGTDTTELSINHLKLQGTDAKISIYDGLDYHLLASQHLSDNAKIVKTDSDHALTGNISFQQIPTIGGSNIMTEDQIATLNENEGTQAPVNSLIQSGESFFTEASPAPICVTDQFARINSHYLYDDKFLPYILGYNDTSKPNSYAHGLVPAGNAGHSNLFLRMDGQWAQVSEVYSGTVSQNLSNLRDYPTSYTGALGKYLKVDFGTQYPDGAGVKFETLSTDVIPIIMTTLDDSSVNSIKCSGVIETQQILVTSDERCKKEIKPFSNGSNVIKNINTKTYKYIGSEQKQIGILAQDLLKDEVLKDSVVTGETGHYKVNYTNLIGVLLSSVKELITRTETLENMIKSV
jgi:hypothetical protein